MRGIARAPATCGELAQGMLEGSLVMVTCPIDLYSTASVELRSGLGQIDGPAECSKAVQAVALMLEHLGRADLDATLTIDSPIPREKGMASSTADIVASMVATASALGRTIDEKTLAELALAVEPSDGIMIPGIALFDHLSGSVRRSLGQPPPLNVLVLEFEPTLDTEAFNATDRSTTLQSHRESFRRALSLIEAGIATADSELVGHGATLSAVAYQAVLPKPQLPEVLSIAEACGAAGVNVAHSGTVIGLLFAQDGKHLDAVSSHARRRLPGLVAVHRQRLIGGGAATFVGEPVPTTAS